MKRFVRFIRVLLVLMILIVSIGVVLTACAPKIMSAGTAILPLPVEPVPVKVSVETLTMSVGMILSLIFNYFPWLNTWYAKQSTEAKSLIMIFMLLIVSLVIFFGSCYGLFKAVTCDAQGIWTLVKMFILTMIANQSTYKISPQTPKVLSAKLSRPVVAIVPK